MGIFTFVARWFCVFFVIEIGRLKHQWERSSHLITRRDFLELLSFICVVLLGSASVPLQTSAGQQLSRFTRLFSDFQQALKEDWKSLLEPVGAEAPPGPF